MHAVASFVSALVILIAGTAEAQEWSVTGPQGAVTVTLRVGEDGGIDYRAHHAGRDSAVMALDWSDLGIITEVQEEFELNTIRSDFTSTIVPRGTEMTEGRETYTMVTGKRRRNDRPWKQMTLFINDQETDRELAIDVRVFEDGFGIRYRLPQTDVQTHALIEDITAFNIGEGGTHLGSPYDRYTLYNPSYELFYEPRPTGTPVEEPFTGWGFPSLFTIRERHILLHESDVGPDDQGWHLEPQAPGGIYRVAPPLEEEARGFGKTMPYSTLPWSMPWRFVVIAEDYAPIVESNMVFDLAAPSTVEDPSWVKPGVASWNWLSSHEGGRSVEIMKTYIDIADDMDLPYTLVDTNWNYAGDGAIEELVAYADERDIDLLLWYNSGGRHNLVPEEPRNRLDETLKRRAEFQRIAELGIRGVKVDFWQSDKQDMMQYYHELMRDAADFGLMTNFHGSTIPRGWERTYPHHMTMEAVKGAEFYSFGGDYGEFAPVQNTIHPFVRNVIGSMDYTPTLFADHQTPRFTTNAHELALLVVFESGIQHLGDSPEGYALLPESWKGFISRVPTVWDETKYLAGRPGDHVVLARRLGDTWYIAGINGNRESRTVSIDPSVLDGLPAAGQLFHDPGHGGFGVKEADLSAPLEIEMAGFGGFILEARP